MLRKLARRCAPALLALGLVAGCASTPAVEPRPGATPGLVLENYFAGRTYAVGLFEGRSGAANAKFYVEIDGDWDGRTLTLDERFLYNETDGGRRSDRRIWRFEKTPAGYIGTAGDVIGEAVVTLSGDAAAFGYLVDLKTGEDRTITLRFHDRLFLYEGGVMLNRAQVSKFGVRVGSVTVAFFQDEPEGWPDFPPAP